MIPSGSPISVIVPVLNDAACLDRLCQGLDSLPHIREIIVSDGGSGDGLADVVHDWGLRMVSSLGGRGPQLNRGAEIAEGEVLWFLHADVVPSPHAPTEILKALQDLGTIGGAFRFRLSEPRWYGPLFEFFIGLRASLLHLPYGDQGYFIRRETFRQVGGFPKIPIMEDVGFLTRIRGCGNFRCLSTPIGISPRRWDREGVFHRTWANWRLYLRFRMGLPIGFPTADYRVEGENQVTGGTDMAPGGVTEGFGAYPDKGNGRPEGRPS